MGYPCSGNRRSLARKETASKEAKITISRFAAKLTALPLRPMEKTAVI